MSKELYEKLKKDTSIVASARFNMSKRLEAKTWWSLFSISSLSISLILITICENSHNIKKINPLLFTNISLESWLVTVLASIIILALSIALSSSKLEVRLEKLNDSAIKINKISREIEAKSVINPLPSYEESLKQYQEVLFDNRVNHEDIDYIIAKRAINKKKDITYWFLKNIYQKKGLIPYYIITYISLSVIYSTLNQILVVPC